MTSLLALLDDIATQLDDVAFLSKVAAKKTAGVLGDDLALNAQQVNGFCPDRELPVVWAVFKGSLLNKAILVPSAMIISALTPWLITPLLMMGGAYLCFEGVEKLAHKYLHHGETDGEREADILRAAKDPTLDLPSLEREKVRGAIRTDFILSAEIVTIALGMAQGSPLISQILVLSGVSLLMTFGVYGLVAGIVKIDDLGLYLSRPSSPDRQGGGVQALGRALLRVTPWLMKALSVAGTVAMFLVGGGILVHGSAFLHDLTEHMPLPIVWNALVGVSVGALVLAAVLLVKKLLPNSLSRIWR